MNEAQAKNWLGENVSRETIQKLDLVVDALKTWNRRINLVGPATLEHVWARHVVDSAQLFALAPPNTMRWMDLGSGAGFPALVLAAMMEKSGQGSGQNEMICVESNGKKTNFLRHCARIADLPVIVRNERIEAVQVETRPQVITARALASLPLLLQYCGKLMDAETILLFPKGRDSKKELAEAAAMNWQMDVEHIPSISDAAASILRIRSVKKG